MDPAFQAALSAFIAASGGRISITSGYRSPERQAQLFADAVRRYGSEEAARKWVAPPGRSNHGRGVAADLSFSDAAAREWAHQNAGRFGLSFPMGWEPWHIEPIGARSSSHRDAYTTPPDGSGFVNPRDALDGGYDAYGSMEDPTDPLVQMNRLVSILGGPGTAAQAAETAGADTSGAMPGAEGANALETIAQAAQAVAPTVQIQGAGKV